ncbi:ABC transporter ATP-binding protein [Alicyclobacillus shizuokensis]|uniref:ABC transporter ATP-binding protein n=1 Tax=Alicyclobacillus shizuokensis TaxID=392014 RepID=UPI00082CDC53|nr:ABC transporter ATP-binding protein [Alicyclobacillus shizuokensis]
MKLQIDGVSKVHRGQAALSRIDVTFSKGVHSLLGPNGSGKSTLMRIMAGVLKPSSGRVLLDGEDIVQMGERYRDILGYLPQSFGLYKNFTAERFLLYISALKGLDKALAAERIEEALRAVHLQDARHRKIRMFSGGMKQRLGIAQALLNDPQILILDEPTAGLDPQERIRFRNLISRMSIDRIVILSTHILSDVEFVSQRIVLIRDGRLLAEGTAEGLRKQMQGKVWTLTCSQAEAPVYLERLPVRSVSHTDAGVELRVVADDQPASGAKLAAPTLEDMYLYYFGEGAVGDEVSFHRTV